MARVCHPCDLTVEVNGTEGSIAFDDTRLNELWICVKPCGALAG